MSGTLRVRKDDGTEKDFKAGDVSLLEAGHDGWVMGDEPVVVVDFQGMLDYGKGSGKKKSQKLIEIFLRSGLNDRVQGRVGRMGCSRKVDESSFYVGPDELPETHYHSKS